MSAIPDKPLEFIDLPMSADLSDAQQARVVDAVRAPLSR